MVIENGEGAERRGQRHSFGGSNDASIRVRFETHAALAMRRESSMTEAA